MPTQSSGSAPSINVPARIRFVLYVATVLGTPVVEYLRARGTIGGLEVALWDSETAAVAAMAAFNVVRDSLAPTDRVSALDGISAPAPAADAAEPPAPPAA